jgi:hypothetical protein
MYLITILNCWKLSVARSFEVERKAGRNGKDTRKAGENESGNKKDAKREPRSHERNRKNKEII